MVRRPWGEGPRTTVVCIDAWKEGVPAGRLYTPRSTQGRAFHSLTHFLQEMELALDEMELKSSFAQKRSFSARPAPVPEPAPPGDRTGRLATFALRVLFRQNVSWQGSITWLEGKQEQSFRSALELVLLMNDALEPDTKFLEN